MRVKVRPPVLNDREEYIAPHTAWHLRARMIVRAYMIMRAVRIMSACMIIGARMIMRARMTQRDAASFER